MLVLRCVFLQKKLVKFLLAAGADIEAIDKEGNTPLHQAVKKGSTDIVKFLLESNANPVAKNNLGAAPYEPAYINYKAIAKLFHAKGIVMSTTDQKGSFSIAGKELRRKNSNPVLIDHDKNSYHRN